MKKILSNKRNIVIGVAAILVVVLAVILLSTKGGNQEEQLTNELKKMAKVYYEDVYYDLLKEDKRSEFLSNYSTLGIKVDLENVVRTVEGAKNMETKEKIYEKFVNKSTGQACSKTKTKIIIYPSEPYRKTDYKIGVELDCGFQK